VTLIEAIGIFEKSAHDVQTIGSMTGSAQRAVLLPDIQPFARTTEISTC